MHAIKTRILPGLLIIMGTLTYPLAVGASETDDAPIVLARLEIDGGYVLVHPPRSRPEPESIDLLTALRDRNNPLITRIFSFDGLDRSIDNATDSLKTRPKHSPPPILDTRGKPVTAALSTMGIGVDFGDWGASASAG